MLCLGESQYLRYNNPAEENNLDDLLSSLNIDEPTTTTSASLKNNKKKDNKLTTKKPENDSIRRIIRITSTTKTIMRDNDLLSSGMCLYIYICVCLLLLLCCYCCLILSNYLGLTKTDANSDQGDASCKLLSSSSSLSSLNRVDDCDDDADQDKINKSDNYMDCRNKIMMNKPKGK